MNKITLLESKTQCRLAYNKPKKKAGRYELRFEGLMDDCNIKEMIATNKSVFENVLKESTKSHELYFTELSDTITEVLSGNMKEEYCKILGDVIIAIDCPDDMELCVGDQHFDLICVAMGKSCYNPLNA